jgi:hypothetical protein
MTVIFGAPDMTTGESVVHSVAVSARHPVFANMPCGFPLWSTPAPDESGGDLENFHNAAFSIFGFVIKK